MEEALIIARGYQSIVDRRVAIEPVSVVPRTKWSRPRKSAAGVIFCVGGRGTNGDPFRSVEAYDCRKNRWFAVTDMGVRRRHVGVVAAHQKL
jgi:hypothetical protein